jgi:hypothetical protein
MLKGLAILISAVSAEAFAAAPLGSLTTVGCVMQCVCERNLLLSEHLLTQICHFVFSYWVCEFITDGRHALRYRWPQGIILRRARIFSAVQMNNKYMHYILLVFSIIHTWGTPMNMWLMYNNNVQAPVLRH